MMIINIQVHYILEHTCKQWHLYLIPGQHGPGLLMMIASKHSVLMNGTNLVYQVIMMRWIKKLKLLLMDLAKSKDMLLMTIFQLLINQQLLPNL